MTKKLTPREVPMTRNINRVFRSASAEQIAAGADWYVDANLVAKNFAAAHNLTVEQTAGIIAALSPLNSWGNNINLAARLIDAGGLTAGYLSNGLNKANAILAGEDPETLLTSNKVGAFYAAIVTAGKTNKVTVDRHAHDIAVGERYSDDSRPSIGNKLYREIEAAYIRSAKILSKETGIDLSAVQVQAITWITWRRRFWSDGAFDGFTAV